jgi:hypothetical protein
VAGLTVVSAFFRGLLTGVVAETGTAGEDLGRSLVRRFAGLLARGGDDDGDVLSDFRQTAADAETALTRLGVAAGALGQYAAGAQAEVAAALRSLGLRDERVQILAPAATTRLIGQVHTDLTAT